MIRRLFIICSIMSVALTVPQSSSFGAPVISHTVHPAIRQQETIRENGIGRPPRNLQGPRARLMARRAAEVQAVRNLARKLGLPRHTVVRGIHYTKTDYHPNGTVVVEVQYKR